MEERNNQYNPRAIAGTIIFHGLLLLLFFLYGLRTPLPLPEEEGVTVTLGYTDQGRGERQPLVSSPPPPQPQPTRATPVAEDIATQSTEEAVALPANPQNRPQPRTNPQPTPQQQPRQETAPPQPEPEPQPQVDPRALFPGRDRQTTATQSQGQTGQEGSQGSPDGSTDGIASTGGGAGNGIEFSLTGRRANSLPKPDYGPQSQGKVVVTITVNPNGQVIRAVAGARGTTTNDRVLWAASEAAALKARFDIKNDAALEQTGTITYNFIRN